MPKPLSRKAALPDRLREILRDQFDEVCAEYGRARPRVVCRRAMELFPAEIEPHLKEWGYSFFIKLAAQEFKAFGPLARSGARQAVLPGLEEHLVRNLPTIVTVPINDPSAEDDFDHIPAERATPAEWRVHRDHVLRPKRDGLTDSIIDVDELLDRGEGCPENEALLPWLSKRNGPPPGRPPDSS